MSLRRVALIALVPAIVPMLGAAAPKGRKPPKTAPKTTPAATDTSNDAKGSGSDAKPTGDEPKPGDDQKAGAPAPPSPAAATPADATAPGAGSGTGTGTASSAKADDGDIDALRQEYLSLRDELFKSRARANAVASQLYSTRVAIKLAWDSGRYYGVQKASIRLDGANVFEDTKGTIASDDGVRFDGYIAPGRHVVTFHVEATGKDDDTFTSTTESQVTIKAVAGKDLLVTAHAHDAGDIAYEWKKSEHGRYGLGIDVGVKTVARIEGGGAAKK